MRALDSPVARSKRLSTLSLVVSFWGNGIRKRVSGPPPKAIYHKKHPDMHFPRLLGR